VKSRQPTPRIEDRFGDPIKSMLMKIKNAIVQETMSMNPDFDYRGLDDEVEQALLNMAVHGERHREHLTRYARGMANRFVWVRASGWK
jgi:hypothetical protein